MIISYNGPSINSLQTCYRPLFIAATATGFPKAAYCDIYVNGIYHVTLTATYPMKTLASSSIFQFDLSGALQPLFNISAPAVSITSLIRAENGAKTVFCRLRSSEINAQGFLIPDGPVPVQAVDNEPAVEGGGIETDPFYVLPYCLQETQDTDLETVLINGRPGLWANNYFRLSNRPHTGKIGIDQVDFYPFLKTSTGDTLTSIEVHYLLKGATEWEQEGEAITPLPDPGAYLVPSGPAQVDAMISVDIKTVEQYFIRVMNSEFAEVCSTPVYTVTRNCEDDFRLLFLNYAGTLDGVTLTRRSVLREVASKSFTLRTGGRGRRFNIDSKENIAAFTPDFDEKDQPWLMELLESPLVWVQTANGYQEMTVTDGKLPTQKEGERYAYEFLINLIPSRTRSTQRG